eukprot:453837-Hanusia_phi.AAC.1
MILVGPSPSPHDCHATVPAGNIESFELPAPDLLMTQSASPWTPVLVTSPFPRLGTDAIINVAAGTPVSPQLQMQRPPD